MLSATQLHYFNQAILQSLNSNLNIQHGSVVVSGGKVIGSGCNSILNVKFRSTCGSRHAESASLINYLTCGAKTTTGKKPCFLLSSKERKEEQ
jgi:pyrimidine deaminase RibD-like protein